MNNYSLWMLEYANCPTQPVSSIVYSKHNEGVQLLTYTYLVMKSEGRIAMVDVGYNYQGTNKEKADRFGLINWQSPKAVLAKIDLAPEDVDTILITHAHFDHMGNLNAFPNAHFYIQKKELDEWHRVFNLEEKFSFLTIATDPSDIAVADELVSNGRMTLIEGYVEDILPGISMLPYYNSHTFGSQMIIINNEPEPGKKDRWVVSGDNCFAYENLLGINNNGVYVPVGFGFGCMENMISALDKMMELTNGNVDRIIIGHEPKTWDHFPSWKTEDGLFVSELNLAPGQKSFHK